LAYRQPKQTVEEIEEHFKRNIAFSRFYQNFVYKRH